MGSPRKPRRCACAWAKASPAGSRAKANPRASGTSVRVDRSYRVFASPRLVRFTEMEYALPREHAADAVRSVHPDAKILLGGMFLQWPIGRLSDRFDRRYVLIGAVGFVLLVWNRGARTRIDRL